MRILQVSIYDEGGGAERVAFELHRAYQERGHDSCLIVGWKKTKWPGVVGLAKERYTVQWLRDGILRRFEKYSGIQAWGYGELLKWWKGNRHNWDIVHIHNMHSGYMDISILPIMARTHPIIQTLHDCWPMTGHCAHFFSCEKWKTGCGRCQDLKSYPTVYFDMTAYNWQRRKIIYEISRPTLVCPSIWMKQLVANSHLNGLRCEVIYNGIDVPNFDGLKLKQELCEELDLPFGDTIMLFVANGGLNNSYKDSETLIEALRVLVRESTQRPILISVGGIRQHLPKDIQAYIKQLEYTVEIDKFFRACDIFVYPTKADNCPIVLIQALAARMPIVTSDVGGCKEIVKDYSDGYVVAEGDSVGLARAIENAMGRKQKGNEHASKELNDKFTLSGMRDKYISLYGELIEKRCCCGNSRKEA